MPFRSLAQRRKFYALKSQGKMSQSTIDKWEEHTPEGELPERLHKKAHEEFSMEHFWSGFRKHAAPETFVSANAPGANMANEALPGAPEKMLKWNDHGGVDPRTPEELQAAAAVKLVTLAPNVPGAVCSTCMHFRPLTTELGHGFCTNPEVKQDVTENMHCANWEHPDSHDPVAAAEEEAQEAEVEQAQMAQDQAAQQQAAVGGNPMGTPGQNMQGASGQNSGSSSQNFGQAMAGGGSAQQAFGQAMAGGNSAQQAGEPSAEEVGGPNATTQKPSPVGKTQGGNPLAQQAIDDFQGQASSSGPMDGGGAQVGGAPSSGTSSSAAKKSKSAKSKSDKKSDSKSDSDSKSHTININLGKGSEKKASPSWVWADIVEGY